MFPGCVFAGKQTFDIGRFFRPTPSWLPPGRPTRSIVCYKLGRMVNWCKNGRLLSHFGQEASVTDGSRTSTDLEADRFENLALVALQQL